MQPIATQKLVAAAAGLLIVLALGLAASNFWSVEGTTVEPLGRFWAGMLGVVPALLMLIGLWLNGRSPRLGGAVLFAGAIPFGMLMWWTVIVPLVVVLLALCWVQRLRQVPRPKHHRLVS